MYYIIVYFRTYFNLVVLDVSSELRSKLLFSVQLLEKVPVQEQLHEQHLRYLFQSLRSLR